ncbi:MAG: prohead protease/major capsid protein fusion protein [Bdellovibrionales bacterium]
MEIRKLTVKSNAIEGSLAPKTLDEKNRTVELIFSVGAPVMRTTWDGAVYRESLSMDPRDVDLRRMKSYAPLLDSHRTDDLSSVIGVVVDAEIRSGIGYATVKFADDPKSDEIFRKVAQGIVRSVSIGYKPLKAVDITRDDDAYPHYLIKNYEIFELSLVGVPADAQAQIRTKPKSEPCEVEIIAGDVAEIRLRNDKMKENGTTPAEVLAERTRISEIRKAVREAGFDEKMAESYISSGTSVEDARANVQLFKKYEQEKVATSVDNTFSIEVGSQNDNKKRELFQEALAHRLCPEIQVSNDARMFQGLTLIRSAETLYGRRIGESDYQLAKRAMSSSDFPLLLANAAEKSLQKRYSLQPKSWTGFVKTDTLRNFEEASQVRTGDFPELKEMNPEGGEYSYGSFGEENELVSLKSWGRIVKFTRASMINDDLKGLLQVVNEGSLAAVRKETDLVYSALTTNKTMADGVALYHADHGNLGTAGVIGEASISEAIKLMRKQTSVDGLDTINVPPSFLICGPDKETEARKALTAIQAAQVSDANPFAGLLGLVVDSKITGNQYYFASAPAVLPTIVLFHLESQLGPRTEHRVNFENDCLEFKVAHDCNAAPIDWRGLVKNAGN